MLNFGLPPNKATTTQQQQQPVEVATVPMLNVATPKQAAKVAMSKIGTDPNKNLPATSNVGTQKPPAQVAQHKKQQRLLRLPRQFLELQTSATTNRIRMRFLGSMSNDKVRRSWNAFCLC